MGRNIQQNWVQVQIQWKVTRFVLWNLFGKIDCKFLVKSSQYNLFSDKNEFSCVRRINETGIRIGCVGISSSIPHEKDQFCLYENIVWINEIKLQYVGTLRKCFDSQLSHKIEILQCKMNKFFYFHCLAFLSSFFVFLCLAFLS